MNPIDALKKAFLLLRIKIKEQTQDGIKFLFYKSDKSDKLIVVFSAFSDIGKPPRYNYIETLTTIDANKLFILDDYGYKKSGSYYLGENGVFFLPPKICRLIKQMKQKTKATTVFTLGSSKGGTAAIYYGILASAEYILAGAPQFFLGDYLDTEKHHPILKGIMGSNDDVAVSKLNSVLMTTITNHAGDIRRPVIFLH